MRGKNSQKSARLVALASAISEGVFDPKTVSYVDLAQALSVTRGTIMRDLREIDEMLEDIRTITTILRNTPATTTHRHGVSQDVRRAVFSEMGSATSEAKSTAAKANGRKGGRPRKAKS